MNYEEIRETWTKDMQIAQLCITNLRKALDCARSSELRDSDYEALSRHYEAVVEHIADRIQDLEKSE